MKEKDWTIVSKLHINYIAIFSGYVSILPEKNSEKLLEIGFIEEMRTTRDNKEVLQTFFHDSPYLRKCDLICLTLYHWQPCILHFCVSQKG